MTNSLDDLPAPFGEPVSIIPPPDEWWASQFRAVTAELPTVSVNGRRYVPRHAKKRTR